MIRFKKSMLVAAIFTIGTFGSGIAFGVPMLVVTINPWATVRIQALRLAACGRQDIVARYGVTRQASIRGRSQNGCTRDSTRRHMMKASSGAGDGGDSLIRATVPEALRATGLGTEA